MRESIKSLGKKLKFGSKNSAYTTAEIMSALLFQAVFGVSAFFSARATVFSAYIPFGVSAVAGCPLSVLPSVLAGAVLGYLFPVSYFTGFRYIAAIFAVSAIRLITKGIEPLKNSPLFVAAVSFAAVFLTGVVTYKGLEKSLVFCLAESILAGGGGYFCFEGVKAATKDGFGISEEQTAAVTVTMSIVLLGLDTVSVFSLSPGRILSAALILLAARYGGLSASVILGVSLSFCSAVSSGSYVSAVVLSFGGLAVGLFSETGSVISALSLTFVGALGLLFEGVNAETVKIFIETAAGSALFLMIPKSSAVKFGKIFSSSVKEIRPEGFRSAISLRLRFAAKALGDVSETVEAVAKELSRKNSPDFKDTLKGIENDACKGCSLQIYCWETRYDETLSAVIAMTRGVKQGLTSPEDSADAEFRGRCLRPAKVGSAVYKHYSSYASQMSAESRIEEVRGVVSDQFAGVSGMLKGMADEFDESEKFDSVAARKAVSALKSINIIAEECSAKLDKFGRMCLEFRIRNTASAVLNRATIMKVLSSAVDRDFDAPAVTGVKNQVYISISERAVFTADIGVNQINCHNNAVCGDAYEYFFDGRGHLVLILSDGMGTGGRAAVDGAMASGLMARLIKAGFNYDSALKILNSSMLFKSTDESLATVDVTVVDLYTGKTELLKAGAAPTIVRRSGKAGKAQSSSLPAGILRNVGFDKAVITLKKGDIILMLSDGAVSEGTEWISAEIESWTDGNAMALAERISRQAKRRRTDAHDDDITVIAAILGKA